MRLLIGALVLVILTLLTQVGGLIFLLAWAIVRFACPGSLQGWRRSASIGALFLALYVGVSLFVVPAWAALAGRVPLPCHAGADRPFAAAHPLYCVLNRHYVDRRLVTLLTELSREVDRAHPGTLTLYLDGNFPFLDGFPLLPHLSHGDGRELDIAYGARRGVPAGRAALADRLLGVQAARPRRCFALRWQLVAVAALGHAMAARPLSRSTARA
jgi:hypothetical protein